MSIINKPPEMVHRESIAGAQSLAVDKYAAFIRQPPESVVNSALKLVLRRDADSRRPAQSIATPSAEGGSRWAKAAAGVMAKCPSCETSWACILGSSATVIALYFRVPFPPYSNFIFLQVWPSFAFRSPLSLSVT